MEIFSLILLILFVARVFAELAERFGQPSLVGALLAGIFIAVLIRYAGEPFGITLDFVNEKEFVILTDLGIFFLMLLAGLELGPAEMREASKSAPWAGYYYR